VLATWSRRRVLQAAMVWAAAVEAAVDQTLDAAAGRLEHRGHGQGGGGHDQAGVLPEQLAEPERQRSVAAGQQQGEQRPGEGAADDAVDVVQPAASKGTIPRPDLTVRVAVRTQRPRPAPRIAGGPGCPAGRAGRQDRRCGPSRCHPAGERPTAARAARRRGRTRWSTAPASSIRTMAATCLGSVIAPSSVVPSSRLLMLIRRTLPSRSSRSRPARARGLVSASNSTSRPSWRAASRKVGR
jgi:hypothetical protein